jgi:hypothetical protein
MMEAGTALGEREANYLYQKWHELIRNLSEKHSSFIA